MYIINIFHTINAELIYMIKLKQYKRIFIVQIILQALKLAHEMRTNVIGEVRMVRLHF